MHLVVVPLKERFLNPSIIDFPSTMAIKIIYFLTFIKTETIIVMDSLLCVSVSLAMFSASKHMISTL